MSVRWEFINGFSSLLCKCVSKHPFAGVRETNVIVFVIFVQYVDS